MGSFIRFDCDVSILVNSLFIVPPSALCDVMFGHCFIVHHLVSFLHMHSSRLGRETLDALIAFGSHVTVSSQCLFLTVQRDGLQCVTLKDKNERPHIEIKCHCCCKVTSCYVAPQRIQELLGSNIFIHNSVKIHTHKQVQQNKRI